MLGLRVMSGFLFYIVWSQRHLLLRQSKFFASELDRLIMTGLMLFIWVFIEFYAVIQDFDKSVTEKDTDQHVSFSISYLERHSTNSLVLQYLIS
jgi:type VI protein secretion system component VasK